MEKIKCMYLCSREHRIEDDRFDFYYNDIKAYKGITHKCSCDTVDLQPFDVVIATPPCNYYSRANYPAQRARSKVAQATKYLLPWCLVNLAKCGKPFLVENVVNRKTIPECGDQLYQFTFGNHTFWSNVFFLCFCEECAVPQRKHFLSYGYRDNNVNVHLVIDLFLDEVYRRFAAKVPLVDYPSRDLEVRYYVEPCDDD